MPRTQCLHSVGIARAVCVTGRWTSLWTTVELSRPSSVGLCPVHGGLWCHVIVTKMSFLLKLLVLVPFFSLLQFSASPSCCCWQFDLRGQLSSGLPNPFPRGSQPPCCSSHPSHLTAEQQPSEHLWSSCVAPVPCLLAKTFLC